MYLEVLRIKFFKLKRAICGRKQSVFSKNKNNLLTVVALYVDEYSIFSYDAENTDTFKQCLSSEFIIKDLGVAKQCLSVRIVLDYDNICITLDQENDVDQILRKYNMTEYLSVSSRLDNNVHLKIVRFLWILTRKTLSNTCW